MKDLEKLDTAKAANEGFELQLLDPGTSEPLGIYITVLGRDSSAFRALQAEQNRKRVARMTKGGSFRVGSLTPDEIEKDSIDLLAACTKSWRQVDDGDLAEGPSEKGTLTIGGEEVACSAQAAAKLYARYPWIREQVDAGVTDRANFIKR